MTLVIGLILGLVRELCVVRYYQGIQQRRALLGSALTLLIGCLDVGVIARLALDRDIWMIIGYTIGETIGTFVGIRRTK